MYHVGGPGAPLEGGEGNARERHPSAGVGSNSSNIPARLPLASSGEERAANAFTFGAFVPPPNAPSNLYPSVGPAASNSNSASTASGLTAPSSASAAGGGDPTATTMSAIPEGGHINGVKRSASEMDAHGSAPPPDAADHSAPVTTTATPGSARRTLKGKGAKDAEKEKEKKTRSKAACAGCKSVKQK